MMIFAMLAVVGLSAGYERNTVPGEDEIRDEGAVRFEGEGRDGGLLVVGSSYAWHSPREKELGWSGDWGMAASARDKDVVHLLWKEIRKISPSAPLCICQCAGWECAYTGGVALLERDFAEAKRFRPDWICFVTTMGNSRPEMVASHPVEAPFAEMVEWFCRLNPKAKVVLSNTRRITEIERVINDYGRQHHLPVVGHDFLDDGGAGYRAYGKFKHAGVAWHPSDAGMAEMARRYARAFGLSPAHPVDEVDPMIGAVTYPESGLRGDESIHGFGKTFPGAATPFGMVQLSPDTVTGGDNGPGYSYTHKTIEGFSFFHMSGIGWYGEFGNFQVMPGGVAKSRFAHDEEVAEAGYYRVRLPDAGVVAELTAAKRSGMIRFTYEKGGTGSFKIDLARRIGELSRAKPHGRQTFRRTGSHAFEGEIVCDHRDGGWGCGAGKVDYAVRFKGLCSKPIDDCEESGGETNHVVRVFFPVMQDEQVVLHVAFDFCGEPEEPRGLDFDQMRSAAREAWERALGAVRVEGGTVKERKIFATALYHAMLDPREIGSGDGFVRRTVFSGWDVYRSEMPLLTLIRPDVVSDAINSLMETVTSGKRKTLPRWDIFGCDSGCMIGQPLVSVMATAYERGIRTFDAKKALEQAQASLEVESNDRRLGFTPGDLSKTLEYAYADWCCGRLAQMMGETAVAARYFGYARAYTNCWSQEVGWMRARTADGGWLKWEGREKGGQGCVEANPWQQGWFVPHDVEGLIRLMGGKARFTSELEKFFSAVPEDFRWNDAYNHPNEPCHTLPYLWAHSDRPEEVGRWTRRICERAYGEGPFGLCGNEDVGQMSAWYVLTAIGFHPLCPGDGKWYLSSPVFDRAELAVGDGRIFTVRRAAVDKPLLNCKPLGRPWVTTSEITAGGVLEM